MNHSCTDDLCDRIDWIAASMALHGNHDEVALQETFSRIAFLQARMSGREATPFQTLAQRLSLSDTEQHVVMLLVSMRARSDVQIAVRQIAMSAELNLDAIRNLIYGTVPSLAAHEELSSAGTLRRLAIIERNDEHGANAHESKQTWTIAPRVIAMLHGSEAIDAGLAKLCRSREASTLAEIVTSDEAIALARSAMSSSAVSVTSGMPGLGRRSLMCAAATDAGKRTLEIDARRLSKDAHVVAGQLRAIARECKLLARTPVVANIDALDEERIDLIGSELVALVDGPVLVTCGVQRPRIDWGRPVIVVEMQQPTSAQRAQLWGKALGGIGEQDVQHLATHYPLAPALISRAADAAKARAAGRKLEAADVYAGIRAVLDDRLGHYAKRVTVTQTWDDLVLPQEQADSITELMARIRERRRVYEDWGFAAKVGKGSARRRCSADHPARARRWSLH